MQIRGKANHKNQASLLYFVFLSNDNDEKQKNNNAKITDPGQCSLLLEKIVCILLSFISDNKRVKQK